MNARCAALYAQNTPPLASATNHSGSLKNGSAGAVWRAGSLSAVLRLVARQIVGARYCVGVHWALYPQEVHATRADFAYETTDSVQLATPENQPVGKPLPPGKQLIPTRRTADDGKLIEVESPYGVAWADASVLRPRAAGLETLDLPVPRTYTVNPPAGTQMFAGTKTLLLPQGTRVSSGRRVHPTLTFHVESTVADGPLTGERGYVFVPDLTPEPRGTR